MTDPYWVQPEQPRLFSVDVGWTRNDQTLSSLSSTISWSVFSIYCKPKHLTFYLHNAHTQNYLLPSVLGLSLGLPLSTSQSTHFFTHSFSVDDRLNDESIVCCDSTFHPWVSSPPVSWSNVLQVTGFSVSSVANGLIGKSMLKSSQFKAGDKSNIENSTDHSCEDTRQNALAALTDLGHVTTF